MAKPPLEGLGVAPTTAIPCGLKKNSIHNLNNNNAFMFD
jgi:hypothetical protein